MTHTEYLESLKTMSNRELLDELYEAAEPDGYDGIHTTAGVKRYNAVVKELEERLTGIGFLR